MDKTGKCLTQKGLHEAPVSYALFLATCKKKNNAGVAIATAFLVLHAKNMVSALSH